MPKKNTSSRPNTDATDPGDITEVAEPTDTAAGQDVPTEGRAGPRRGKPQVSPSPERRRELLDVAAEVFAEQGYNATTVRKIADSAGMLAGSLYYHFESKESMVDEILSVFLGELWHGYDGVLAAGLDPRRTIEALVTESFREIDRHRAAVAIYQKESRQLATLPRFQYLADSQARFEDAWLATLQRGVADGVFRDDLDIRLTYRFVRDTVWVAASWYRPGGQHSPEEIARQYLSMVLDGIAVRTT